MSPTHRSTAALAAALTLALAAGACAPSGRRSNEVHVAVTDRGFEPATTPISSGHPVTLVVTRKTDQTCATEIVFPSLGTRYALPLNKPVRIELGAAKDDTLRYVCGMNMLGGMLVVE